MSLLQCNIFSDAYAATHCDAWIPCVQLIRCSAIWASQSHNAAKGPENARAEAVAGRFAVASVAGRLKRRGQILARLPAHLQLFGHVERVLQRAVNDVEHTPRARHADRIALLEPIDRGDARLGARQAAQNIDNLLAELLLPDLAQAGKSRFEGFRALDHRRPLKAAPQRGPECGCSIAAHGPGPSVVGAAKRRLRIKRQRGGTVRRTAHKGCRGQAAASRDHACWLRDMAAKCKSLIFFALFELYLSSIDNQ